MFIHELGKFREDCTNGELRQVGYCIGGTLDVECADDPVCDPRQALASENS